MNRRYAEIGHYAVRAIVMAGFAALIAYLVRTGDIKLYIAPHLVPYADGAAAVLILLAGYQVRFVYLSLRSSAPACACGHDHDHGHGHGHDHDRDHERPRSALRTVGIYGLFLLPLLLGSVLPNTAFAGSLAQNKGMNLGGAPADDGKADTELVELEGNESPELKKLFKTQPYNRDYAKLGMLLYQQDLIEMKEQWFIEKLEALNKFVGPFQGKKITITGFVYRDKSLSNNQFIVGRMAMTHCIADIAPYGIIVEASDAPQYADESWITVTGTIGTIQRGERDLIKIIADDIEISQPSEIPYVYPDLNFASKLAEKARR